MCLRRIPLDPPLVAETSEFDLYRDTIFCIYAGPTQRTVYVYVLGINQILSSFSLYILWECKYLC